MAIFNDKFQYRIRAEKNKDTKDAPKGWSEASKTNGKYNIKLNLTTIKNAQMSRTYNKIWNVAEKLKNKKSREK